MNCILLTSNEWLELNNAILCSKFKRGNINSKKKKNQQMEFQSEHNFNWGRLSFAIQDFFFSSEANVWMTCQIIVEAKTKDKKPSHIPLYK